MSVRKAMTVRDLLELLVHIPVDTELNVTIAGDIHEIHSAQISIPGDGTPGIIDFQSEDLSPDTAPVPSKLDDSDMATILAALRLFQRTYRDKDADDIYAAWPEHFTASSGEMIPPLGTEDIDELCERLNCGGVA